MGADKPLENMRSLGSHTYIVWTQAGFRQAIRALHQSVGDAHPGDQDPVESYPRHYPCLVEFDRGYSGYHYWKAVCTPLSSAIESARDVLQKLEAADAEHRAAVEARRAQP